MTSNLSKEELIRNIHNSVADEMMCPREAEMVLGAHGITVHFTDDPCVTRFVWEGGELEIRDHG